MAAAQNAFSIDLATLDGNVARLQADIDIVAPPTWRALAAGTLEQQEALLREIATRLGHRGAYAPPEGGDAIAHWVKYDSWRPPSRPGTTFPQTDDLGFRQHDAPGQPRRARRASTSRGEPDLNRDGDPPRSTMPRSICLPTVRRPIVELDIVSAPGSVDPPSWRVQHFLHPGQIDDPFGDSARGERRGK